MRKIKHFGFVGLLLAGMGAQAFAQQPLTKGWQAGAALPYAAEGLKEWTNQSIMGLCVDGAYQMPLSEGLAAFRLGFGVNYLPGKEQTKFNPWDEPYNMTVSLTGLQISADLLFPIGSTKLSLFTGISLNTWIKKASGQDVYFPTGVDPEFPNEFDYSVSGTIKNAFGKYGLRLGAEYAINDRLSLSLVCQVVELGTDSEFYGRKWTVEGGWEWDWDAGQWNWEGKWVPDPDGFDIYGKRNVNPAWVQLGVRYKF